MSAAAEAAEPKMSKKSDLIKVIVADGIDADGLGPVNSNGSFNLVFVKDQAELDREIGDAQALLVRSKTKVTADFLKKAPNLKFVGRAGVGIDNIDVPASTQRGIVVQNVPGGNTISAAEHTFALILALSRNIPQADASTRSGQWKREKFVGTELQGKVLGLIGFGRIGKEVAKRAQSFEMKVMAYDPFVSEAHMKSNGIAPATMDDVFKKADYISLHIPVTEQSRNLINDETLAKMKPDARLINCARGELVDEAALLKALEAKKIKGAALDVFTSEPPKNQDLFKHENLILTPHLGASTEEAQVKVALELGSSMKDFFEKGVVRNAVNLPSLEPEVLEKATPYVKLSEKLGRFVAQIVEGGIQEITIEFAGEFSNPVRNVLTLAAIKGILANAMGAREINWVNALPIAKERGILVKDSASSESEDYTSLITIKVKTDKKARSVSGTILSKGSPRIVRVDDLPVDITPEGHLLVFTNIDRPGVVGFIGTLLGENKINIAAFQVGRKSVGGEAVSVLNVDTAVSPELVGKIRGFSGITNVWVVNLD